MRHKAGFTLIEITVSLVLVGLIASIAGTLVITATRGYLYARENDVITQKAQLALGRLNREFTELMDVKARDDVQPYLIYEVPLRTGGVERRGIAKVGNTVQMFFNVPGATLSGLTGDILVDSLADVPENFSIMYNPSSGMSWWGVGDDIRDLYAVSYKIVLARPDTGGAVSFYSTVSPRNNNNAGGAALPTASNPPPEYTGKQCFVTTAAYGDADHPVVIVLRQFRDRFLLPTAPGKALVRFYYEVGPSLAAAIEDRPLVCLLVRLLVTPVAGFALLSLTSPVMIPLILLLSGGLARLIIKALRRRSPRWRPRLQGQRGAMLVTLIAAMVVFAALGVVMIAMFGTASLSQSAGNYSMRAYYLAESGFRYAASEYVSAANEDARETLMANLHGTSNALSSGDGAFQLSIFPYYFKKVDSPPPEYPRQLVTRVFGGLPNGSDFNSNSWVKVTPPSGSPGYEQIAGVVTVSNLVKFNKQEGQTWPGYAANSVVTPVCIPDRDVNSLKLVGPDVDGRYDLAFKSGTGAQAFPEKNGIFTVKFYNAAKPAEPIEKILSYRQRDLDNNRLKGISDPNGGTLPTGPMEDPGTGPASYNNFVALTKFMRVVSTGTFGTGSAAVSRAVTFFAPIGYARATPIPKTEFKEAFDDATLSKWFKGVHGSHIGEQAQSSSIGPALQFGSGAVTRTLAGTRYFEGQIGLNWSAAIPPIPLSTEWLRASKYLSYDAQAKIYFWVAHYKQASGLTFRLDDSGNAMGLSYGVLDQGLDQYGRDKDYIPDPIVSSSSVSNPVITLWAKQYNKTDSAFTVVSNPGPQGCTGHPDPIVGPFAISSSNSAVWETGFRVRFTASGGATLPGNLAENTDYFVRRIEGTDYFYLFDSYIDAFAKDASIPTPCWVWDRIRGITNAGSTGSGSVTAVNQDPAWTNLAYQELTTSNWQYGLYSTATGGLIPWSTFLVRLIEAPSVSVLSTASSTGREIVSGDRVYTTSDNSPAGTVTAVALVRRNPVYRSSSSTVRNWSGKTAQAVLLLEPITESGGTRPHVFGQGKTLFVGEGVGVEAGVVNIPSGSTDIVYRDRDQWIAVYVADPTGPESSRAPDKNPFNIFNSSTGQYQRGRILRTSVRWPVDDVEYTNEANDFFTVVRFRSFVNSTLPSCKVSGGSGILELGGTNCLGSFYSGNNDLADYPDILRFTSPDGVVFNSPTGTTFSTARPEVGLHNFGGGITSFDDFALQFGPGYGITRQGFMLPIQQ